MKEHYLTLTLTHWFIYIIINLAKFYVDMYGIADFHIFKLASVITESSVSKVRYGRQGTLFMCN